MSHTRQQAKGASSNKVTNGEPIPPPRKKKKSNSSQFSQDSALSNMASDSNNKEAGNEVQTLRAELHTLKQQLLMHTQTTDRQISLLLKETTFIDKVQNIADHTAIGNGILTRRLDDFEARSRIEVKFHCDTEVTIVAQGVPYDPSENP